jgi:hypothetical protein
VRRRDVPFRLAVDIYEIDKLGEVCQHRLHGPGHRKRVHVGALDTLLRAADD